MEIKLFVYKPSAITAAFLTTFHLQDFTFVIVSERRKADAILIYVDDNNDLYRIYSDQFFIALTPTDPVGPTPANVRMVNCCDIQTMSAQLSDGLKEYLAIKQASVRQLPSFVPLKFKNKFNLIVIDDKNYNLEIAEKCFESHNLIAVNSLEEAVPHMRFTTTAVLTDMEMLPDKMYPSLSLSTYKLGQTVDYGFAVMIEATAAGIPVAIVTDGNHHQSWVSAMFDEILIARVNNQRVVFCNDLGKRWDLAFLRLYSNEPLVQQC